MSYVSEKLGLEKGSFSSVAHHLIDIGYVNKIQDRKDKRVFLLELTPKGAETTKSIIEQHCLFIKNQIDKLSDIEKDTYYSAVKLIISMTEKLI
jgi:DNA-binding MarR family transcriptional regulator